MSRLPLLVGPAWPPVLSAYDHMSTFAKSDWAWEGMRRNPRYQADAAAQPPGEIVQTRTPNGVPVIRMLSAAPPVTPSWDLCPFRRSAPWRPRGEHCLVGPRWDAGASRNRAG